MHNVSKWLTSLILLAAAHAPVTSAQDAPVFQSSVRTVLVYATVIDARGRLVPDLDQTDFSIEDGGRAAAISVFSNDSQPFTAVVMLDTSASMTANVELLKRAAGQFLSGLSPADRVQVGAFNDRIQLSGTFTNQADDLLSELGKLEIGNPTRLHDGIAASLDALRGIEGRRIVLVFSDGEDTASRTDFKTVLERARDEEVMVYAIGLESQHFDGTRVVKTRPSRDLRRIAEETGGGYFELVKTADLASTFSRVVQELRSHYLLGFAPAVLDGKLHKLEVRVAKTRHDRSCAQELRRVTGCERRTWSAGAADLQGLNTAAQGLAQDRFSAVRRQGLRCSPPDLVGPHRDGCRGTNVDTANPAPPVGAKRQVFETGVLPGAIDELTRSRELLVLVDQRVASARIGHRRASKPAVVAPSASGEDHEGHECDTRETPRGSEVIHHRGLHGTAPVR